MRPLAALLPLLVAAPATGDASPAATAPAMIEYSAPEGEGPPADADVRYSELVAGQHAWRARDGAPVTVQKSLGRARQGDRVDARYLVVDGTGHEATVFGGELTSLYLARDLDGDGVPEQLTVRFGGDFQIYVREARSGSEVILHPAGGAYLSRRGGNASLQFVDGAALPLARVDSKPEACADWWESYLSFVGGRLRVALTLDGLTDPPVSSTPTVRFDARARTATVTTVSEEEDEAGKTHRKKQAARYRLDGGVFRPLSPHH